jgi:site-specific DNA-methyltransferase (cytosine-N4-specific)
MHDESKKRLLRVTAGNLRQSHIYVRGHLDFFPPECLGASRKANGAGKPIQITLDGIAEVVSTDLATTSSNGKPRGFFRGRHWVRKFFQYHKVVAGDILALERLDRTRYRLSVERNISSILTKETQPRRWKTEALNVDETPEGVFCSERMQQHAYYADRSLIVMHSDVLEAARCLTECGIKVDCIVTSPPFYGQRDYGVQGQIGLEDDPQEYVDKLVNIFNAFIPILKKTGSLWVNLGDTYWSGRGEHKSGEGKQAARRFGLRPQDKRRKGPWTRPKQLLLIPHRLAIAMQGNDWIVRNDNVWVKPNPIPDQVRDRCSMSHEYMFHFVRERFYYFVREAVGRSGGNGTILPAPDTWVVPPSRGGNGHKAAFSEDLITIPIKATCHRMG